LEDLYQSSYLTDTAGGEPKPCRAEREAAMEQTRDPEVEDSISEASAVELLQNHGNVKS